MRVKLDEERYARRAAEARRRPPSRRPSRGTPRGRLEEQLSAARSKLKEVEEARESERRELERCRERLAVHDSEREHLSKEIEIAHARASAVSEREGQPPPSDMAALTRPRPRTSPITLSLPLTSPLALPLSAGTLLSELGAKRAQAEAERQHRASTSRCESRARLLQSGQRVGDANAAMAPLRQQAEHAGKRPAETRLSEPRRASPRSRRAPQSSRPSVCERGRTARPDAVAEAEAQLSQVRAEASSDPQRQPESA